MGQLKNALDLVRGFRRALGMVDPGGVERLGDSLSPVIDIWSQPEWRALRGETWAWGRQNVTAGGAGLRSQFGIWNPATSDRVVVVRLIVAAQNSNLNVLTAALGNTLASTSAFDSRRQGSWLGAAPTISSWVYQNTAAMVGNHRAYFPAAMAWTWPVVLGPGTGLAVDPGGDNVACAATIVWSERAMLPGERSAELR